ncbi:MAG: trehalose-phosphatase, partial [Myxococcota bacterium]|nr:trehalose-phosphatase [Myxococcota bacterium]
PAGGVPPWPRPRGFEIGRGACVVEARPRGVHKGRIVRALARRSAGPRGRRLVAVGDDRADEDLFGALGGSDVGIVVSGTPRPSAARWRLRSPGEVLRFLGLLAAAREGGDGTVRIP